MADKERINKILRKLGTDLETQPIGTQKKLLHILDTIEEMISSYEAGKTSMKENKINISNVSKKSNISRKTFYNNEILGKFVELFEQETTEYNSIDKETLKRLKDNKATNDEKLETMLNNIIDIEEVKCENDRLMESVNALQDQYDDLRKQYEALLAEKKRNDKESITHTQKTAGNGYSGLS